MDKRRELAAGRALERSALYQLLSQVFAYPGKETVETLRKVDLPKAKEAAAAVGCTPGSLDPACAMALKELAKADEEFDKAEDELMDGKPDKAIGHYKHAWERACKALRKLPDP